MDKSLILTVAAGSILHRPTGRPEVLRGLPEDAQELWENGASFLMLKKDSAEFLNTYSRYKLEQILKARRAVGYEGEIRQLEKAVSKTETPAKPKKTDK